MSNSSAIRLKAQLNLGAVTEFQRSKDGSPFLDENGFRVITYKTSDYIDIFPLIYHPEMLDACCEMNLFLIQRAKGEYSTRRNKREVSIAWSKGYVAAMRSEPLDIKTVESISKDLKLFLDFLIKHKLTYLELIAAPISESSIASDIEELPIWKYQRYLVERVKGRDLGWGTANRMIRRVREFYIWSYHRGIAEKLPFELQLKAIRKKKSDDFDILYSIPNKDSSDSAIKAWVSNLSMPKIYKQKSRKPDGLQPFNKQELTALLSTDTAKHSTYGLFLKCAYLAGLRSFEVVQIDYDDIVNPTKSPGRSVFKIGLVRKHHMQKPINISSALMGQLFTYTQSTIWKHRRKKHEEKYGINNPKQPLPLFLNSSGERMAHTSASDTIQYVRKEQRVKGLEVLKRSYHDLRSTFGTYLAIYLIQKFEDPRRVRSILRKWMGHEESKTTEHYIDFAKAADPSEFGAMHDWIEDIYSAVEKLSQENEDGAA